MPAPPRFDAQAGTAFSEAEAFVAGYGPSSLRYSQSLSGSMTPTGSWSKLHVFVFDQVSVTLYRALNRTKRFVSVFRTSF